MLQIPTLDEIIQQQINEIEEWLRDHPDAHPVAINEMRSRLHEQQLLLNNKTIDNGKNKS